LRFTAPHHALLPPLLRCTMGSGGKPFPLRKPAPLDAILPADAAPLIHTDCMPHTGGHWTLPHATPLTTDGTNTCHAARGLTRRDIVSPFAYRCTATAASDFGQNGAAPPREADIAAATLQLGISATACRAALGLFFWTTPHYGRITAHLYGAF